MYVLRCCKPSVRKFTFVKFVKFSPTFLGEHEIINLRFEIYLRNMEASVTVIIFFTDNFTLSLRPLKDRSYHSRQFLDPIFTVAYFSFVEHKSSRIPLKIVCYVRIYLSKSKTQWKLSPLYRERKIIISVTLYFP